MDELDDEALRDRLDAALGKAEDADKAVHTLDAMLNEPQVLIPVDDFGEILYAIIKEDTVVTVLPKGHGEEILHRGQALQAKVANGEAPRPEREPAERWDRRRAWRREPAGPVVIERPRPVVVQAKPTPVVKKVKAPAGPAPVRADNHWLRHEPTPDRPGEAVAGALWDALERGSRRAAVQALHELLERKDPEDDLLPIWNEIAGLGIPQGLKLSDLIDACALSKS
jgi:hypothetical protein